MIYIGRSRATILNLPAELCNPVIEVEVGIGGYQPEMAGFHWQLSHQILDPFVLAISYLHVI